MSTSSAFVRLLTDSAAVLNPTATTDDYRDQTFEYPDPASVEPVPARFEQQQSTEIQVGRDTQISDWLLYLMPDVEITGDSRVVRLLDGTVFEVVGPPNVLTVPRSGPHHIEARLVSYLGTA